MRYMAPKFAVPSLFCYKARVVAANVKVRSICWITGRFYETRTPNIDTVATWDSRNEKGDTHSTVQDGRREKVGKFPIMNNTLVVLIHVLQNY